eukprot:NP_510391.1 Uncharacterized protein CELE_K04G11.1 [Caenorhabditis elegans]
MWSVILLDVSNFHEISDSLLHGLSTFFFNSTRSLIKTLDSLPQKLYVHLHDNTNTWKVQHSARKKKTQSCVCRPYKTRSLAQQHPPPPPPIEKKNESSMGAESWQKKNFVCKFDIEYMCFLTLKTTNLYQKLQGIYIELLLLPLLPLATVLSFLFMQIRALVKNILKSTSQRSRAISVSLFFSREQKQVLVLFRCVSCHTLICLLFTRNYSSMSSTGS